MIVTMNFAGILDYSIFMKIQNLSYETKRSDMTTKYIRIEQV